MFLSLSLSRTPGRSVYIYIHIICVTHIYRSLFPVPKWLWVYIYIYIYIYPYLYHLQHIFSSRNQTRYQQTPESPRPVPQQYINLTGIRGNASEVNVQQRDRPASEHGISKSGACLRRQTRLSKLLRHQLTPGFEIPAIRRVWLGDENICCRWQRLDKHR